jgi:hypothetical protein
MTTKEILAYNAEQWLEVADLGEAIARHSKLVSFNNDTPHLRVKRLSFARDSILAFLCARLWEDGKPINAARQEWLAADYVD